MTSLYMSIVDRATGRVLVISGPSGSGKSTLLKKLFKEHPGSFGFSISHTTRTPRPGEMNGREYYFVNKGEFDSLRDHDLFLEWAEFSNNLYGTSIESVQKVLDSGKICILDIDLQGVHSVKRVGAHLNPRYVFIKPPSFAGLKARLIARATESPESLALRLETAEQEMRFAEENPSFHDCIIVNDNFETAYKQLDEFIFSDSGKRMNPQSSQ